MNYAYARVSSADQNLARQLDSFIACGVLECNIFSDKKSGKDFDRDNYLKLISLLKKDDLVVIKSIDRLGRNYDMIIREWARITKDIGADILVLDMPLLDTRTRNENLTGKLLSDIVLQLLSYVAQKERENIGVRQQEGIASAKIRGVRFGRPKLNLPNDFDSLILAYQRHDITFNEALRRSRLRKSTFYTRMKRVLHTNQLTIDKIKSDSLISANCTVKKCTKKKSMPIKLAKTSFKSNRANAMSKKSATKAKKTANKAKKTAAKAKVTATKKKTIPKKSKRSSAANTKKTRVAKLVPKRIIKNSDLFK